MISFDPIDLLESRQSGRTNVLAIIVGFFGVILIAAAFVMWAMAKASDEPITAEAVVENTADFLGVSMPAADGGAVAYGDLLPQSVQGWNRIDYSNVHLNEVLSEGGQSATDHYYYKAIRDDFAGSGNAYLATYRNGTSLAVVRVKEHPFRFDQTRTGTPQEEIATWQLALSPDFLPAIVHGVPFMARQDAAGNLRTYRGSLDGFGLIEIATNASPADVTGLIGQIPVAGIADAMGGSSDYVSAGFGVILADATDRSLLDAVERPTPSVPAAPAAAPAPETAQDGQDTSPQTPAVVVRNGGNGLNQTKAFGSRTSCRIVEGVRRCN